MRPPLEVPSEPPRSSTGSMAMPYSRIAVLSEAGLTPGSPEASPGVGRGSPSVCSTSHLETPRPTRPAESPCLDAADERAMPPHTGRWLVRQELPDSLYQQNTGRPAGSNATTVVVGT